MRRQQPLVRVLADAAGNPLRRLSRTLLTGIGTLLGVAALVSTAGLVQTAGHQVNSTFDALRATQVSFTSSSDLPGESFPGDPDTELDQVAGVTAAGEIGQLFGGAAQPVRTLLTQSDTDPDTATLPIATATPGALRTMNATLLSGRLLTAADTTLALPVGLLGAGAASSLNLGPLAAQPVVFVNNTAITIVGVLGNADRDQDLLTGVIVSPALATRLSGAVPDSEQVIADTAPGAAQQVGRQAPLAIDPNDPKAIMASVPPDPNTLRRTVTGPVRALAILLAVVTAVIGLLSIGNVASMSVLQRTQEIGLRRALGATRTAIFAMILLEALLVGLLSGLIGTAVGVLITVAVSLSHHWTTVLDPAIPLLAAVLGAATGLLSGLVPAYRATRITPAAALRSA